MALHDEFELALLPCSQRQPTSEVERGDVGEVQMGTSRNDEEMDRQQRWLARETMRLAAPPIEHMSRVDQSVKSVQANLTQTLPVTAGARCPMQVVYRAPVEEQGVVVVAHNLQFV